MKFKKVLIIVLFLIVGLAFSKCKKMLPDDTLTLSKDNYQGSQLRIDGYYFYMSNGQIINTFFFYKNGIILFGGGSPIGSGFIDIEEKVFLSSGWLAQISSHKTNWGLFLINEDNIQYEKWYPSSGGGLPAYIREGEILNDTTFHITVSYRSDGSSRSEKDETYHFKQFSPKPDSTNNFVK
jgi:hypothetical protein